MKIGLTYNVRLASKSCQPASHFAADEEEEFDSPETIQALADALTMLGHDVELLGDGEPMLRKLLDGPRPELVLNIAEGTGSGRSREARVPAVLEMLGIPYTGSDPLTLSVTLDKDCAKRIVAASGVATPLWALYTGDMNEAARADFKARIAKIPFPVIVKPACEGSSKGILNSSVLNSREDLDSALEKLYQTYRQAVLVEEFIDGDELTVGLVGNKPPEVVGIMRMLPTQTTGPFVYSLEVKRDWERLVRYECPAKLAPRDTAAVRAAALAAWRALGCRDVSRIDFRLRDGVPYFLEINPLPGLSPVSGDLVLLSRAVGIEHPQLIAKIVAAACERLGIAASAECSAAFASE